MKPCLTNPSAYFFILFSLSIFGLPACALFLALPAGAALVSSTTNFSVQTDPQDALIFINDELVGVGMVTVKVNNKDDVHVVVTRDGYIGFQRTFESSLSPTGWEFDQDSLYVRMVPETSPK